MYDHALLVEIGYVVRNLFKLFSFRKRLVFFEPTKVTRRRPKRQKRKMGVWSLVWKLLEGLSRERHDPAYLKDLSGQLETNLL